MYLPGEVLQVFKIISEYLVKHNYILRSGGAKGADRLGECYAFDNGYSVIRFQALWGVYGKSAGPRRNNEMAKFASESGSGTLIAFWDGESRGTKNIIDTARRYGLHVIVVEYEKDSEELNEQKR